MAPTHAARSVSDRTGSPRATSSSVLSSQDCWMRACATSPSCHSDWSWSPRSAAPKSRISSHPRAASTATTSGRNPGVCAARVCVATASCRKTSAGTALSRCRFRQPGLRCASDGGPASSPDNSRSAQSRSCPEPVMDRAITRRGVRLASGSGVHPVIDMAGTMYAAGRERIVSGTRRDGLLRSVPRHEARPGAACLVVRRSAQLCRAWGADADEPADRQAERGSQNGGWQSHLENRRPGSRYVGP